MSRGKRRRTPPVDDLPVRPLNMPRLRDRCAVSLRDVAEDNGRAIATFTRGTLYSDADGRLYKVEDQEETDRSTFAKFAKALRAAELFWVTHPMSVLVDGAHESLPDMTLGAALNPTVGGSAREIAECGFLLFETAFEHGDLGFVIGYNDPDPELRSVSRPMPVRGLAWGPAAGGMMVVTYADTPTVARQMARDAVDHRYLGKSVKFGAYQEAIATAEDVAINYMRGIYGPLFPAGVGIFPLDKSIGEPGDPVRSEILARLLSTWLMMSEPLLTGRESLPPDPRVAESYRRAKRPDPDVTVIVMRQKRSGPREPLDPNREIRTWKYRVPVRGCWRDYWTGPGRTILRPRWIGPHWAGPVDGPVRVREHVNYWKR